MRLQKAPLALLGALSLKNEGINPPELGDAILGTVDVYDQYLHDLVTLPSAAATITAPATGGAASITVPLGVAYRVLGIGVWILTDVADVATRIGAAFSTSRTGAPAAFLPFTPRLELESIDVALGVSRATGFLLDRPLFLPSGWVLSVGVGWTAAPTAPSTFTLRALVQELPL